MNTNESQDHAIIATDRSACPAAPSITVTPAWNTRRHDHGVEVRVDLPGVRKEDLKLEASETRLRLEGRRSRPAGTLIAGQETPDLYSLELRLGRGLDIAKALARFENGVLALDLPLLDEVKPRQIEIH
ncbi:MAG: Hsp20/alpha crystallin family protein [Akkermansiaceae bacterium]|jgi:HSP20 family protein|nr:Hsp20/alpha crystallin family protein [Akkermansiaceae bacterium]